MWVQEPYYRWCHHPEGCPVVQTSQRLRGESRNAVNRLFSNANLVKLLLGGLRSVFVFTKIQKTHIWLRCHVIVIHNARIELHRCVLCWLLRKCVSCIVECLCVSLLKWLDNPIPRTIPSCNQKSIVQLKKDNIASILWRYSVFLCILCRVVGNYLSIFLYFWGSIVHATRL